MMEIWDMGYGTWDMGYGMRCGMGYGRLMNVGMGIHAYGGYAYAFGCMGVYDFVGDID